MLSSEDVVDKGGFAWMVGWRMVQIEKYDDVQGNGTFQDATDQAYRTYLPPGNLRRP